MLDAVRMLIEELNINQDFQSGYPMNVGIA